jgi:hypothetical protein
MNGSWKLVKRASEPNKMITAASRLLPLHNLPIFCPWVGEYKTKKKRNEKCVEEKQRENIRSINFALIESEKFEAKKKFRVNVRNAYETDLVSLRFALKRKFFLRNRRTLIDVDISVCGPRYDDKLFSMRSGSLGWGRRLPQPRLFKDPRSRGYETRLPRPRWVRQEPHGSHLVPVRRCCAGALPPPPFARVDVVPWQGSAAVLDPVLPVVSEVTPRPLRARADQFSSDFYNHPINVTEQLFHYVISYFCQRRNEVMPPLYESNVPTTAYTERSLQSRLLL